MKRVVVIFLSIFVFSSFKLYAQSEWLGKWQTDPIVEGVEKIIMEYYFKNDSAMSMSFVTDKQISGVGRCISRVSIDGKYDKTGPLFFICLNQNTIKVSLLRFVTYAKNASVSKKQIIKQIENTAKPMFANFENVRMIYVTHESPDTISFVFGDENNAIDMEYHRPTKTIEQVFDVPLKAHDSEVNDITYNATDEDTNELSPMLQMWKSTGFFILYIILAYVLICGVKYMFAKHLTRTQRAKKSVIVRRFYSVIRFVLRIIIIVIGGVLWVFLLINAIEVNEYIALIVLCGGGSILLSLLSSLSLPMNFMTMKKFMSKERIFILYLRGFVTDDYSPKLERIAEMVSDAEPWKSKIGKTSENPNDLPLSEKNLAKAWKKCPFICYEVFSVGRPEELESPEGTKRIYLNNESWEEDVKTLMKLAKYILVCIHPNDNCIWEIRQCNTLFPEKTIYYIDNVANLDIIRDKMGEELPACLKSQEITHNHMMVYQKNGETFVKPYSNTDIGLTDTMNEYCLN